MQPCVRIKYKRASIYRPTNSTYIYIYSIQTNYTVSEMAFMCGRFWLNSELHNNVPLETPIKAFAGKVLL